MPLWGKNDAASNGVLSAPAQFDKTPNVAETAALFGNNTADAYEVGATIGLHAISANEMNVGLVWKLTSIAANVPGTGYTPGDELTVANTADDANVALESTVVVLTTELASVTLNGPGTGGNYIPATDLTIATGTADVPATANITATEVRTVAISVAGTGYANGDTVKPVGGTQSTNAVFTVTTGAADTIPASLALTNRGTFTANPTLLTNSTTEALTGTGTGLKVDLTTRIKTIAIKERGSFTANPTASDGATTNANTGTGATVDTTVRIESLAVLEDGLYEDDNSADDAALAGGDGSDATAVVTYSQVLPEAKAAAHTGWNIRREGSGGRAGRVTYETLVAMKEVIGDSAGDDDKLPE
jgi:hypothetical protein